METYERIYQQLRKQGEPAWTGSGYQRAWIKLTETLNVLERAGLLPKPGSLILELGCGNGAMASLWFARRGYRVCGVDISHTAIRWAQESFAQQGITGFFQQGNVCSLAKLDNSCFDLIFDGSCMHCLVGVQRGQAYSEVKRLLRPNGRFVLSSMCGEPRYEEDCQQYDSVHHVLYREGKPWRTLMPLRLLQQEIIAHGFTIQHKKVNKNPWWDHATLCVAVG